MIYTCTTLPRIISTLISGKKYVKVCYILNNSFINCSRLKLRQQVKAPLTKFIKMRPCMSNLAKTNPQNMIVIDFLKKTLPFGISNDLMKIFASFKELYKAQ